MLVENILAPNVGPLGATLDEMTSAAHSGHLAAFKVYTAWSPTGQGYSLEDPAIGLPTVQHAHDLGIKVFVAHKGLPLVNFDPAFNHPEDVVAVSRQFPDMNFVIYHSAWDPSHIEGPYDPTATIGIDTLLAALDRHGVPPNDNIWVDTATMWRQLLTQPDQAAHALGKILSRVGEKRVMWGTDSIWYGSPQPQIMAMRAFQITPEYQEQLRLSGPDRRGEGRHLRPQRGPAVRDRPHRHPLRAGHRSADRQHLRDGVAALRRRPSLALDIRTVPPPVARSSSGWPRRPTHWTPDVDVDPGAGAPRAAEVRPQPWHPIRTTNSSTGRWPWPPSCSWPPGPEPRAVSSGRQLRLRRLLASESGTRLVFSLADRVLRPTSARTAAGQLAAVTAGDLDAVSVADRMPAASGRPGRAGRPRSRGALVAARLRRETGTLVYPAESAPARTPSGPVAGGRASSQPQPPGRGHPRVAGGRASAWPPSTPCCGATTWTASRSRSRRWPPGCRSSTSKVRSTGSPDRCATSTAAPGGRRRGRPSSSTWTWRSTGTST